MLFDFVRNGSFLSETAAAELIQGTFIALDGRERLDSDGLSSARRSSSDSHVEHGDLVGHRPGGGPSERAARAPSEISRAGDDPVGRCQLATLDAA